MISPKELQDHKPVFRRVDRLHHHHHTECQIYAFKIHLDYTQLQTSIKLNVHAKMKQISASRKSWHSLLLTIFKKSYFQNAFIPIE